MKSRNKNNYCNNNNKTEPKVRNNELNDKYSDESHWLI